VAGSISRQNGTRPADPRDSLSSNAYSGEFRRDSARGRWPSIARPIDEAVALAEKCSRPPLVLGALRVAAGATFADQDFFRRLRRRFGAHRERPTAGQPDVKKNRTLMLDHSDKAKKKLSGTLARLVIFGVKRAYPHPDRTRVCHE